MTRRIHTFRILAFFDDSQIPWRQCEFTSVRYRLALQKIRSPAVGVREFDVCARIIEVVVKMLAQSIHAMLQVHRRRQIIVSDCEPCPGEFTLQHCFLQRVR